jgi:hypothetical protein
VLAIAGIDIPQATVGSEEGKGALKILSEIKEMQLQTIAQQGQISAEEHKKIRDNFITAVFKT